MPEIDRHALSRGITINRPATELTKSTGVEDLDNRSKSKFGLRPKSKLKLVQRYGMKSPKKGLKDRLRKR